MIEIRDLALSLGRFELRHVSFTVEDGEYLVLLGPTGAGKTVLLECIVGLHRRHAGTIAIDNRDVTGLFPEERNIGYVPQDYALFPNMTVEENLAYGLKAKKVPRQDVMRKVRAMLARLGITALSGRFPSHLSGGEKQRVALGRALVTEPRVLLLDEPLAALDENTRSDLAAGLREIQRSLRGTFVHVCHNLEEALEVADRVAVIHDGAVVQVGTPEEILHRPASLYVARLTRTRNLLSGRAESDGTGAFVTLDGGGVLRSFASAMGRVVATIRPERIRVIEGSAGEAAVGDLRGRVVRVSPRLSHVEVEVDVGQRLMLHLGHAQAAPLPRAGQGIWLRVGEQDVCLHPFSFVTEATENTGPEREVPS